VHFTKHQWCNEKRKLINVLPSLWAKTSPNKSLIKKDDFCCSTILKRLIKCEISYQASFSFKKYSEIIVTFQKPFKKGWMNERDWLKAKGKLDFHWRKENVPPPLFSLAFT
jgi:hypothetical protein